jgi:hypothetical protein
MLGADFLIRHGQDFSHLDLRNSPGQYLNAYYNTSYPSGADTLFGGSAFLVHVPLIWAFQPFNALMLALATGPAWVLVRRIGLGDGLAALATLSVTLPALVYGYELIASVKEITALTMILTLGALVVLHPRWLRGPPLGVVPFALVAAAGISALGVAFGAWALTAVIVLAAILIREVASGDAARGAVAAGSVAGDRSRARGALLLVATGVLVALLAALGTWLEVSGSLQVAKNIASTTNPGNLQKPLRSVQILGTWLVSSYKHVPTGGRLHVSYALAVVALIAAVLGALYVVYLRAYALAAWLALTLAVWLALTAHGTTWADGKALMLTSPVIVLLAWAGVAALRASFRGVLRPAALLLALALAGGVAASDALQYHGSNLAPTARYDELASIDSRFAGRGPALFTDYDEYALYELRDLDVGGPGFMFPPRAIVQAEGQSADLERASPAALRSYPLILTRRDPSTARPPAAYRLLWQGTYYQVWGRSPGAPAALAHVGLSSAPAGGVADRRTGGLADRRTGGRAGGLAGEVASGLPIPCSHVAGLARLSQLHGARLVSASPPELVRVDVASALHPTWAQTRLGLLMTRPGRLTSTFVLPHAGPWDLWLQGEIMPPIGVQVDGHQLASISGQLTGVATDPNTMAPLRVSLAAGPHRLTIARGHSNPLAPGSGGSAILDSIFLTPVGSSSQPKPHITPTAQWHSLCGARLEWIEVVGR